MSRCRLFLWEREKTHILPKSERKTQRIEENRFAISQTLGNSIGVRGIEDPSVQKRFSRTA